MEIVSWCKVEETPKALKHTNVIMNYHKKYICQNILFLSHNLATSTPLPLFVWISGLRRTKKLLEVIFGILLVVHTALKVVSARFNEKLNFYLNILKYLRDSA